MSAAIEAAQIIERHAAGEDGDYTPRVFVICHALGGMFLFDPDEALARIEHHFSDLSDAAARASTRHLTDRVRACLTRNSLPDMDMPRRRWMDWRADDEPIFRI